MSIPILSYSRKKIHDLNTPFEASLNVYFNKSLFPKVVPGAEYFGGQFKQTVWTLESINDLITKSIYGVTLKMSNCDLHSGLMVTVAKQGSKLIHHRHLAKLSLNSTQ